MLQGGAVDNGEVVIDRFEVGEVLLVLRNAGVIRLYCVKVSEVLVVIGVICGEGGLVFGFLEPLKPSSPADAHDRALPFTSVRVTIVLL